MRIAYFINTDVLIDFPINAWVIDKTNPKKPLALISEDDLYLYQMGMYKKDNCKIMFNGNEYWLNKSFYNELLNIIRLNKININDLGISFKEYLDINLINEKKFTLKLDFIKSIKNTTCDIFLITNNKVEDTHDFIFEKLQNEMKSEGMKFEKIFYLNGLFSDLNSNDNHYKSQRIILKSLLGFDLSDNEIVMIENENRYDEVIYVSDDMETNLYPNEINLLFSDLYKNSTDIVKTLIRDDLKDSDKFITSIKITNNFYNKEIKTTEKLSINNIIKTFESFVNIKKRP